MLLCADNLRGKLKSIFVLWTIPKSSTVSCLDSSRLVLWSWKNGLKDRLENRACDPDILHRFRWTNLARFGSGVFGHSRESLALCNPYPGDRRKIQKWCSWFLSDDFVFSVYDLIPKGVKLVILSRWQIQISEWTKNVSEQIVLLRGESDRELVCEFHTLIIHDFAAAWHKNGQSLNCPWAAGFFGRSYRIYRLESLHGMIQAAWGRFCNRPP